jgi:Cu(I)/Ag(I) efflux system membrane fusion protein
MKKYLKYGLILFIVLGIGFAFYYTFKPVRTDQSENQNEIYTCSMHPEIIRDKPGNCPICGMTLVQKPNPNQKTESSDLKNQLKPTNEFVIGDFETITPIDTSYSSEIKLPGVIGYDQNSASNVAARVGGRIEKMYVNYKYQSVAKGQKLFDLYSPELVNEQQNFLYLISNDAKNSAIISAAKSKLLLYGMTNNQISALVKSKTVNPVISIYSPTSGIISDNEGMVYNGSNSMVNNERTTQSLNIVEGNYIKKNETIFKLLNTNKVWAIFNVLQGYNNLIYINQPIKIFSEINENDYINGKVGFIQTQLSASEKTNRIRIYLNNTQKYPIGLRLQGILKSKPISGLWITKSAVVRLGNKSIVFMKKNNGFKVHEIQIGLKNNDRIQVTKGLTDTDKIAQNAQYLVDSESFIKTK